MFPLGSARFSLVCILPYRLGNAEGGIAREGLGGAGNGGASGSIADRHSSYFFDRVVIEYISLD